MPETTLVLLHGRGHEPSSMHALVERLGLDGVTCVAPAAPGGSWYADRFFAPRARNEPALTAAIDAAHRAIDEVRAGGVPAERIVLGGFSQGACVAADALARRPRPLGGLAVICGGLIGTDEELAAPGPGTLDGLPVLITGVEDDAWVPVARVRDTAARLRAAGAEVELLVQPPADHAIHDAEVDALRRQLRRLA